MQHYLSFMKNLTIREFFAHWNQLNDYLADFPLFAGCIQKIVDDKMVKIVHSLLSKSWQSKLLHD